MPLVLAASTHAAVNLQSWTAAPWSATSGVASFSGTVTDPSYNGGTAAAFTFDAPKIAVDVSAPASPNFTPSTVSTFGFEPTGFGVGDNGLGRFTRGESFALKSARAFKLNQITWAEFTGDEVLHLAWTNGGAAYQQVYTTTANPSVFANIVADANTPIVITNVSASNANLSGRLRFGTINVELVNDPSPANPVAGSLLPMNNWTAYPFNGVAGGTGFTGALVAPENGGTAATMTFANPKSGVTVTTQSAPDFATAVASTFGFEGTGFGVGGTTLGRFERGESFTLQCAHQFQLSQIFWNEFTGDEAVHIKWTQAGVVHQQVFNITASRFAFTDLIVDANTPVVFTNVSLSTANLSGRLRFGNILASLVFASDPSYPYAGPDGYTRMFGVNLAGGEGGTVPGTYGTNYIYPNANEFTYYNGKNQNLIRLPFRWPRVQRTLYGALDSAEMTRLDGVIALAASRGMKVLLDMHDYARYNGNLIGSAAVPNSAFTDVWQKIAARYSTNTAIYAYGIMNEPHSTGGLWPAAAQAGVDGVRLADTIHWVTVCGENWASAATWPTSNPNLNVSDSANKLIYEAHCYFANSNNDQYGTYDAEGAYPDKGVVKVSPFIYWLKQRGARGLIGEFGVPNNDARWNVVLDRFLAYLYANGVSGTYWAGGPWWSTGYTLSCEPTSNFTVDKPQMSILQNYE
ncbi:MAG: cellulase family glycosylhydrolase [Rariglobus sp.]